MTRLVIVPGHGVCRHGRTTPDLARQDDSWDGIFPDEAACLVEHARAGVAAAGAADALLVMSGGQTRLAAGPRSEGESYLEIARDAGWWGNLAVGSHAVAEDYARDSLENLLFSVAVFLLRERRPPEHITIAGWGFKGERFAHHAATLRWPAARFTYQAVNDPPGSALETARQAERIKVEALEQDPFLAAPHWRDTRAGRDPFHRGHPYVGIDPRIDTLLAGNAAGVEW